MDLKIMKGEVTLTSFSLYYEAKQGKIQTLRDRVV